MKKVFRVTTGYEAKEGGRYDKGVDYKNVIADTPLRAAKKVKMFEDKEVKEVLESIELVCVIDVE